MYNNNKNSDGSVYKNTEGTDTMNKIKGLLEKENIRSFVYVLYSFACTLLFPLFVSDTSLAFSNSAFSLLLFFAMFLGICATNVKIYVIKYAIYFIDLHISKWYSICDILY